ncbi:MAG: DUF2617 family protein [Propionibacteriaceae bacterium]|nr:DUF2617 family protein [Propionibacteriaceae bacterium]
MLSPIDHLTRPPRASQPAHLTVGPTDLGALLPAVATRPGPGFLDYASEFRILGDSHQVILRRPGWMWSETLSGGGDLLGVGGSDELSGEQENLIAPGLRHRVRVNVEHLTSTKSFCARADDIDRLCRAHETSLVVRFAGDALAFTAIGATAGAGSLRWETWRLYPETGDVVASTTRVSAE